VKARSLARSWPLDLKGWQKVIDQMGDWLSPLNPSNFLSCRACLDIVMHCLRLISR
jgi:hypothetical protein